MKDRPPEMNNCIIPLNCPQLLMTDHVMMVDHVILLQHSMTVINTRYRGTSFSYRLWPEILNFKSLNTSVFIVFAFLKTILQLTDI